jgi:hypothetical protein
MVTTSKYYQANKERILAKNAEWLKNNYERKQQMSRDWYHRTKEANLVKYLWKYAKARAKKKNLPFTITLEDIIIPEMCPIFKVPFILGDIKYCPSIDRIEPKLGYVKENIQVISNLANRMKWDSNREELLIFCKGVIQNLEGG